MPTREWYNPEEFNQKREDEVIKCRNPKCNSEFFEQVEVWRYPKYHNVTLGQPVPAIAEIPIYLLRCIKCGEVYEPTVNYHAGDIGKGHYTHFLDIMEEDASLKDENV